MVDPTRPTGGLQLSAWPRRPTHDPGMPAKPTPRNFARVYPTGDSQELVGLRLRLTPVYRWRGPTSPSTLTPVTDFILTDSMLLYLDLCVWPTHPSDDPGMPFKLALRNSAMVYSTGARRELVGLRLWVTPVYRRRGSSNPLT